MDESKIIIIGANGQLGKALQAKYPSAAPVDREELDITDSAALETFDWSKFDIILNAAAYTNVDGAETEEGRKLAWQINALAVAQLAKIAAIQDITIVHVSTDYVFDGTKSPHNEDEFLTPLSVYGESKAAGDIAVSIAPKHYILRTSWVIGDGPNFVRTMIGLAKKDISPSVVNDQIGRLTFTNTLVEAIHHLLTNTSNLKPIPYGTYNVSNDGEPASWAEITRTIFKELGRDDLTVTDTTTAEYFASKEGVAPRPLQSTLNIDKIKSAGFTPTEWQEELKNYIIKNK